MQREPKHLVSRTSGSNVAEKMAAVTSCVNYTIEKKRYIILKVYFDRFNFDDGVVLVFVNRIKINLNTNFVSNSTCM